MGGQCTRTDVSCSPTQSFVGFDPSCEPNSRCCVPRAGFDAGGSGGGAGGGLGGQGGGGGSTGTGGGGASSDACSGADRVCWTLSASCPSGTVQDPHTCAGVCCSQGPDFCGYWGARYGHCVELMAPCGPDELQVEYVVSGSNCDAGQGCCIRNTP